MKFIARDASSPAYKAMLYASSHLFAFLLSHQLDDDGLAIFVLRSSFLSLRPVLDSEY